eukprot:GHVU01141433.1.p3 GENE.GHVU01141433.1~~GHVU01141433.1.p3  ORF type:complete len:142 (+),score=8.48 GHVU01141433.1:249-674(+)
MTSGDAYNTWGSKLPCTHDTHAHTHTRHSFTRTTHTHTPHAQHSFTRTHTRTTLIHTHDTHARTTLIHTHDTHTCTTLIHTHDIEHAFTHASAFTHARMSARARTRKEKRRGLADRERRGWLVDSSRLLPGRRWERGGAGK